MGHPLPRIQSCAPSRVLRALVVDDEEPSRQVLADLATEYCESFRIVATAASAAEARRQIAQQQPDIVFLDVKMPGEDGFELLESLPDRDFLLVFVTSFDHFALRAIKSNAVDYLLKPVSIRALQAMEDSLQRQLRLIQTDATHRTGYRRQVQSLLGMLENEAPGRKLILQHTRGFEVVDTECITYLEADRNYTIVYLDRDEKLLASRPLGEIEEELNPQMFCRIHKSFIINLSYLRSFINDGVGYALLTNGVRIEVARRRMRGFVDQVRLFAGNRV